MSLRAHLERRRQPEAQVPKHVPKQEVGHRSLIHTRRAYQDLKVRIHRQLLERIDLTSLAGIDLEQSGSELRTAIMQVIDEQAVPFGQRNRGT